MCPHSILTAIVPIRTFIFLSILIIFLFTRRRSRWLRRPMTSRLPLSRPPPISADRAGHVNAQGDHVIYVTPSSGNNGSVFIAMPPQAHTGAQDTRGTWVSDGNSGRPGRSLPGIYFMEGTRIRFAGQESGHDDLPRYEEPPPGYDKVIEEGGATGGSNQQNTNLQVPGAAGVPNSIPSSPSAGTPDAGPSSSTSRVGHGNQVNAVNPGDSNSAQVDPSSTSSARQQ